MLNVKLNGWVRGWILCAYTDIDVERNIGLRCPANFLSVEITDVCLQSKSKDSHWLFLHVSVCDWLQKFVCCFNVISKAKSTEKWTLFIQNYRYLFVLLVNFFHNFLSFFTVYNFWLSSWLVKYTMVDYKHSISVLRLVCGPNFFGTKPAPKFGLVLR